MPFTKPSAMQSGNDDAPKFAPNINMGDLADEGALVVITYRETKPEITTVNGVSDADAVDLLVVTGRHAGTYEPDRLVFNVGIRNVLAGAKRGDMVLGRIERRGQRKSPCLVDPRQGDEAEAERALARVNAPF